MLSVLNTLSEYTTFTYQKKLLHTLFCFFLKSSKAFSVSLIKEETTAFLFPSFTSLNILDHDVINFS